jgi:hypothetical protein
MGCFGTLLFLQVSESLGIGQRGLTPAPAKRYNDSQPPAKE